MFFWGSMCILSCSHSESKNDNAIDITNGYPTTDEVSEYFSINKEHLAPIEGIYLVQVRTTGQSTQDDLRIETHYIFRIKHNYNGFLFGDFKANNDTGILHHDRFYFYSKSPLSLDYAILGDTNNYSEALGILLWHKTIPTHISVSESTWKCTTVLGFGEYISKEIRSYYKTNPN